MANYNHERTNRNAKHTADIMAIKRANDYRRPIRQTATDKEKEYLKALERFLIEQDIDVKDMFGKRGIFTGITNYQQAHSRINSVHSYIKSKIGIEKYNEWKGAQNERKKRA